MKKENIVLDEMPEKAHKSIHFVSFIFTALIIGVILFFISQILFMLFVVDDEERAVITGSVETVLEEILDMDLGHDSELV